MDWAEKEVASLELSKKLKELGFPQNREGWYWIKTTYPVKWILAIILDGIWLSVRNYIVIKDEVIEEIIKAPTNSELGEWLPPLLKIKDFIFFLVITQEFVGGEYEWRIYYAFDEVYSSTILNNSSHWDLTEANARAKTVIWLKENGYITFNQGDKNNAQPRQQA